MDRNERTSQQSYRGTGRILSSTGGFVVGGIVGSAVAIPLGILGTLKGKIKWTTALIAAWAVPTASAITGAVVGWRSSAHGEKQFHQNQEELAVSRQQISQLTEEVGNQREQAQKFTDIISAQQRAPIHASQSHVMDQAARDETRARDVGLS